LDVESIIGRNSSACIPKVRANLNKIVMNKTRKSLRVGSATPWVEA